MGSDVRGCKEKEWVSKRKVLSEMRRGGVEDIGKWLIERKKGNGLI